MNKWFPFSTLIAGLVLGCYFQSAQAEGNPTAGKAKSEPCAACHNKDGNSTNPAWPKLAGQHANYIVNQLKAFKAGAEGPRDEAVMKAQVAALSVQDFEDLAAYYAQQVSTVGETPENFLALGERIYRGGNVESGVAACAACHGPAGQGNEAAGFPALAGQMPEYVKAQLVAFQTGKRGGGLNGMMHAVSSRMTTEEMKAVSYYIAGLSAQ